MDKEKRKAEEWMSVPQFGDWDQKQGGVPDYSMDFSKIREMRKQNKREVSRASLGNDEEFVSQTTTTTTTHDQHPHPHEDAYHKDKDDSPIIVRRSIFSYFNCCVKA